MNLDNFLLSSSVSKWAPCAFSSFTTDSSIDFSTTIDCSDAQITPLSNVLESMILFIANFTSALLSIKAGPFPGPTPIAGVPDE